MGVGSLAIGLLPTPQQIGITASILLVAIRIVQGISVAGEYTVSGILVVEEARERSRAFVGSWIAAAMMLGCVLGSAVPALMNTVLTQAQMSAWGWRVPFFVGSAVAVFSVLLRLHLPESSAVRTGDDRVGSPVLAAVRGHWRLIVQMIVLLIPTAVIYFIIFVYAASYLTDEMHFSSAQALDITTVNLVVIAVLAVVIGLAGDRFGLRAVFMAGALATLVLAVPMWWLMHRDDLAVVFAGQLGFSVVNAVGWALSITALTLMAPPRLRCSTVAVAYNVCMAAFGGTTPLVATYLVGRTGDDYAPVFYVLAATALSLLVIVLLPRLMAAARAADPEPAT